MEQQAIASRRLLSASRRYPWYLEKVPLDPSLTLDAAELNWAQRCRGKSIAVLGSGDNQVVFALSGMGAKVTSIDISEQQLMWPVAVLLRSA